MGAIPILAAALGDASAPARPLNGYIVAANAVVLFHLVYVAVVLLGLLLIGLGGVLKWKWVRNFWFRALHLSMMSVVVVETVFGIECPLTTWENQLRRAGGDDIRGGDFIARFANDLLFPTYTDDNRIYYTIAYYAVGALVFLTFFFVRPNWPWRSGKSGDAGCGKRA